MRKRSKSSSPKISDSVPVPPSSAHMKRRSNSTSLKTNASKLPMSLRFANLKRKSPCSLLRTYATNNLLCSSRNWKTRLLCSVLKTCAYSRVPPTSSLWNNAFNNLPLKTKNWPDSMKAIANWNKKSSNLLLKIKISQESIDSWKKRSHSCQLKTLDLAILVTRKCSKKMSYNLPLKTNASFVRSTFLKRRSELSLLRSINCRWVLTSAHRNRSKLLSFWMKFRDWPKINPPLKKRLPCLLLKTWDSKDDPLGNRVSTNIKL